MDKGMKPGGLRLWCGIGGVYYYPRPAQAPAIRGFLDRCAEAGVHTLLSAAVSGEPASAYRWMHDWPAWAQEGLIHTVTLRLMTDDRETIAGQVRAARQAIGMTALLVAQLCCWGERRLSSVEDVLRAAHTARDAGADAIGLYRADSIEVFQLWPAVEQLAGRGL